ncbi:hypothetical protein RI129_006500 [Pyrocoelia pectoralis]|uniref:Major facilitator superfamily (MFS) profile domain-containing protein n=1 Tax=Pyrocoelia pectoralis TaxID=417401 RepID=A0AAN7ZG87_9COLE
MRFEEPHTSGTALQLVAVLSCALSGVSDGMHYAWTAPIIPILQNTNSTLQITEADVLWLENIYMIGGFAGIPFTILTIDRFGRKSTILVGVVQSIISWILIAFGSSIEYLYVARFLSGVAADVGFVAVPMYVAEVADKKIRGFLGSWIYLMMLVGVIIIYSIGPFVSIPVSSAVGCAFLLVELFSFPFMPESPYYYILKNNRDAARKSLQRLRSSNELEEELDEITAVVNIQRSEQHCTDLVVEKNSRKALLILTVLNLAQHFSGYSVILMNFHSILNDTESAIGSNNTAIVYSIIMFVAALLASVLVDKVGRKILLSSSSTLTGISVLILAIYFSVKSVGVNIESFNWIPIFSVMLFAVSFKVGLGIVPIVSTGELFPTNVKALGMTAADGVYMFASILSVYVYQHLKDNYGNHVPFFMFAGCCFVTTIFTIIVIPETKGRTLHEIQLILGGNLDSSQRESIELKLNDVKTTNIV